MGILRERLALLGRGRRGPNRDASWRSDPVRPPERAGWTRSARYLAMPDGTQLAIDLYLPSDLRPGERLPAILRQTRYWRSTRLRWPWRLWSAPLLPLADAFVRRGYAWVDVDVRGSGASGGVSLHPWNPDEIADGARIVDWIVAQPWSNGRVGATGVSYDGTSAEMLLANAHPAVKAIAPRFALFDVFADVAFPGGVHLNWFTENWQRTNDALDGGDPAAVLGCWVDLVAAGVAPVDDDPHGVRLAAHQRGHAPNGDVHRAALAMTCRDDPARGQGDFVAADFSPHARLDATRRAGAAILSYSGWLDGAYANAAIQRFHAFGGPEDRLVLGPWNHGGEQNIDPRRSARRTGFDHAGELVRFFDRHLLGPGTAPADSGPRVAYYTLVEGRWKTAERWPPACENLRLFLAAGHALAPQPPAAPGEDVYRVDLSVGTGTRSRWRSLMGERGPIEYPDRRRRDARLLVYDGVPLAAPLEVTGHPRLVLHLAVDAEDAAIFAYLEDVGPDGEVGYVTEGQLRALHRAPARSFARADARPLVPGEVAELDFALLPTSYRFETGHRVRLALAAADADHFRIPPSPPHAWRVQRGAGAASRLELPVVRGEGSGLP